jgi:hypothetical protein
LTILWLRVVAVEAQAPQLILKAVAVAAVDF